LSEFEIATGERLLVYSDGLSDQANGAGQTFDLSAELRSNPGLPLPTLIERITSAFDAFRGECTTADDVTIVGIDVVGTDAPPSKVPRAKKDEA
jgi:serine phosphatase RsbU (regulator of sigma subunit)